MLIFKRFLLLPIMLFLGIITDAKPFIQINEDSVQRVIQRQSAQLLLLKKQQENDSLKRIQLEERLKTVRLLDDKEKDLLMDQLSQLKSRDSLTLSMQRLKIDSLRNLRRGTAVIPFRDSLFTIYTGIGSFSVKDRAEAISNRIKNLASDFSFVGDSLKIIEEEETVRVVWKDKDIVGISEEDALWANSNQKQLATAYKTIIAGAIAKYRDETSWQTIIKEAGLAALVVLLVILVIICINKLISWLRKRIENNKQSLFKGFTIKGYQVVNPDKQIKGLWVLVKIIKWILILLIIYLALPVLFNIFPHTQGYADILLGYFLSPLKKMLLSIVAYLPNLITIIVIVTIFFYLLRFLKFFAIEIRKGNLRISGFYPDWALPTYQLLRVLILAFMMVVTFPYLPGSNSGIFKGVSVFIGVLFTFGSAGALGNIVAGMVLTYMRAFTIGDRVRIGDITGDIIEKSLLVTRVRTIKNEIISIPNSTVMNSHTINFSSDAPDKGLIVHTTITIGYDVPWKTIHKLAIDAAMAVDLIEKEPQPFVLQTSLDDFYVSYQINAYTKHPNKQAIIYSDLHQQILDKFNEAGVEIMSPHYRAARDGNTTTIPSDYLPKDYQVPSFNINVNKRNEEKP